MTKTTEENLSQSKYAEHRNVTKGYIILFKRAVEFQMLKAKGRL